MIYKIVIEKEDFGDVCRKIYHNNVYHHDTEPAYSSSDGYKAYYKNGQFHRLKTEGPARMWGALLREYWENGSYIKIEGEDVE